MSDTHALFVRALLMLTMIAISINVNNFFRNIKFHYISETAVHILVGFIVAMLWTAIEYDTTNSDIQLSSNFFYMVLLPPIIFEGGFTLQKISFFKNLLTIVSLAFAGALYSTFVTSVIMYYLSKLVSPWTLIESLVFGSLISSTDPVTVLSLLPSNVDKRLYMIIFGESALNDAVSIILYRFFTSLEDPTMRLGAGPFFVSVFASAGVFLGSVCVGIAMALIFALLTKHLVVDHERPLFETVMLIVFAYCSYLIADIIQLTGIISVFFCGVAMAHYAHNNLSHTTHRTMKYLLRTLSFICECFIFLYLGMGLLSFGDSTTYSFVFILFAIFAILVSRSHVFIVMYISNCFARTPEDIIPFNHQLLIWFSALRGAVAFALGVTFLENQNFSTEIKGIIFGTTVIVIVFTVLVMGGLTPYALVWLGIIQPGDGEHGGSEHGGSQDHHGGAHQSIGGAAGAARSAASGMPPMAQHGAGAAAARAAARRQGSQASLPSDKAGGLLNALNTPALEQLDEELESPSTAVDASSPQRGAAGGRGAAASDAPRSSIFAFLYRMDVEYIRPYFTVQGPAGPRGMDASSEMLQRMTSQQLFEQGDARPVVDGQGSGSGSMAGGAGSLASPSSAFYGKPSAAATPRGAPAIPEDGEEGAHEGERLMAARGGSATAAVLHFNGGAILGPQRSRQFSIGGASSVGGGSVNVAPGAGFMNTSMSRIPGVGTVSSPGLVLAADDERELAFEAHDEEDEDDVHIGRDLVGRR